MKILFAACLFSSLITILGLWELGRMIVAAVDAALMMVPA